MFVVYNGWTQKHDWETNGKGKKKAQVNDSTKFLSTNNKQSIFIEKTEMFAYW